MLDMSLGDRMKQYEGCYRNFVPSKLPIILKLDGKNFSRLTSKLQKPFDHNFNTVMEEMCIYLANKIQGCKMIYTQSDELSILIYEPDFKSEIFFNGNIQKMVSVSAALASSFFSVNSHKIFGETKMVEFDSRIVLLPIHEVNNFFEWRQQDFARNSLQMLSRANFSHKQCEFKNASGLHELLYTKNINWNDLPLDLKRGRCIIKKESLKEGIDNKGKPFSAIRKSWVVDKEIPIFHKEPNYINQYLKFNE